MEDLLLQMAMVSTAKNKNCSLASIDSRTLSAGQIFFALPGNNVDGHDFLEAAVARGASAVVVNRAVDNSIMQQVVVNNVERSLFNLSKSWRALMSPFCIGITGSNGKTTTKEMISHVLKVFKTNHCSTFGNLNNDLGVALSLLQLRSFHEVAVLEMGANGAGQIAKLSNAVRPNIGVFTNASECHLSGFGSLDGVVKAKAELFTSMKRGSAIINIDSYGADYCLLAAKHLKVITIGNEASGAMVTFKDMVPDNFGYVEFVINYRHEEYLIKMRAFGEHNAYNACAAIAALVEANFDVQEVMAALSEFSGVLGRLTKYINNYGVFIFDDTYNASPASYRVALKILYKSHFRNKWLICGDMMELGHQSEEIHLQLMQHVKDCGINRIVAFGPNMHAACQSLNMNAILANSVPEIIDILAKDLAPADVILVKGSRSLGLEKVIQYLLDDFKI